MSHTSWRGIRGSPPNSMPSARTAYRPGRHRGPGAARLGLPAHRAPRRDSRLAAGDRSVRRLRDADPVRDRDAPSVRCPTYAGQGPRRAVLRSGLRPSLGRPGSLTQPTTRRDAQGSARLGCRWAAGCLYASATRQLAVIAEAPANQARRPQYFSIHSAARPRGGTCGPRRRTFCAAFSGTEQLW